MQLRQPSSAWLRCEFARHLLCQNAAPRRAWPAGLCSKATLTAAPSSSEPPGSLGGSCFPRRSRRNQSLRSELWLRRSKNNRQAAAVGFCPAALPSPPQLRRGFFAFPGLHYSSPGRRILLVVGSQGVRLHRLCIQSSDRFLKCLVRQGCRNRASSVRAHKHERSHWMRLSPCRISATNSCDPNLACTVPQKDRRLFTSGSR